MLFRSNGDFAKFQHLTGTKGDLAKRIFDAVAVGMNAATGKKALKESIDGEEMLKILQQTHHEPIVNDEMIDWIKDHRWGVKMIQPKDLPDYDDDVYYDDPFSRVMDIDMGHVKRNVEKIRNGRKIDPIILGPGKSIIDGNHRAQAARELKIGRAHV